MEGFRPFGLNRGKDSSNYSKNLISSHRPGANGGITRILGSLKSLGALRTIETLVGLADWREMRKFVEYKNYGPGAAGARPSWTHTLTDTEAENYTYASVFN